MAKIKRTKQRVKIKTITRCKNCGKFVKSSKKNK